MSRFFDCVREVKPPFSPESLVRFTEEQVIEILKEHELGAKTADVCRKQAPTG
jgi:hypothetical protein